MNNHLLKHLHNGNAANILRSGLIHLDERTHVALHELHPLAAHHARKADKRRDSRDKAREPEPPIEHEEQREHSNHHRYRTRNIGKHMGEQGLRACSAAIDNAPEGIRGVHVEEPERQARKTLRHLLAHVGRTPESCHVRAHEPRKIASD